MRTELTRIVERMNHSKTCEGEGVEHSVRSYRGEYFHKILGGSIVSTDLYQTMTKIIVQ